MVDSITDPLVHMVRNAVDHGLERPEVRERLGKTACRVAYSYVPITGVARWSLNSKMMGRGSTTRKSSIKL